jgi:hypothetical protein
VLRELECRNHPPFLSNSSHLPADGATPLPSSSLIHLPPILHSSTLPSISSLPSIRLTCLSALIPPCVAIGASSHRLRERERERLELSRSRSGGQEEASQLGKEWRGCGVIDRECGLVWFGLVCCVGDWIDWWGR